MNIDMHFNQGGPEPIFHIESNKIKPNPYQPRKNFDEGALNELASSIREYGILHPLVVTKSEISTPNGADVEYHLISGERRLMAAKIVGLERVPVIIKSAPTERERLELAIIENIQRENLNPIETARAYAKLQEQFGLTQREIAIQVGKSRESVANIVRLLNLPAFAQEALSKGQINESQARILLMVSDMKEQQAIFNDLVLNNLSVRELRSRIKTKKEQLVKGIDNMPEAAKLKTDPELISFEEQLMEMLGTKVKLQTEGSGGKLTISFYSKEELQSIINKLTPKKAAVSNFSPEAVNSANPKTETSQQEEKLLEEKTPDYNPDDLPMIIKQDDLPASNYADKQPGKDFVV